MNRNWMIYIGMMLMGCFMLACQQESVVGGENGNLALQLRICPSETGARATSSGDDVLNENKLTKIDCFFYPQGGETGNAVYTILNHSLDRTTTGTITVTLEEDEMQSIFPNGATTCVVYMIANRPVGTALPENDTRMATLKALTIEAEFDAVGEGRKQEDFVMDGQSNTVTLITEATGKKRVSGNIDLYRAASKIELLVTGVEDEITEGGVLWVSDPSNMYLRMHQGVKKSHVDAGQQPYSVQNNDYFVTSYEKMVVNSEGHYTSALPYYSYPSDWNADEEHEVYFTLVLPWAKVETDAEGNETIGVYRTCYYQVPVNFNGKQLLRNTHYRLNLEVGVLGSFDDPDDPETPEVPTEVTLEPSYIIVPWSDNVIEMNTQMDRATYLVVDRNYAEMHNVGEVKIGYASSHAITSVTVDRIEYYNYQNAATRKVTVTKDGKTAVRVSNNASATAPSDGITYSLFVASVDEATGKLTFTNNTNASSFYTTQDIYLTITNEAGLSEQIRVRWFPPIYFLGDLSNGIVFSNGYSYANPNGDYTSQYEYYSIKNDNGVVFGTITNPDYVRKETSNNNENQYNIYITSLPSGSDLQIGDPREVNGGTLDGLDELTNYRKTRTDAGNVVAPIFKIASSFGKTSSVSFTLAQQRCASYQENGYPAGRWRIPTEGEFKFIIERSSNGDIPSLFGDSYWAGSGKYYKNGNFHNPTNNNNNNTFAVRCVYDVWYWGDNQVPDITQPYWGDNGLKTHAEAQP